MKIAFSYTTLFLLIIAFSSKMLTPVWVRCPAPAKENTEQQERNPEEKNPEKVIEKEKFETGDLVVIQQWTFSPFISRFHFYTWQHRLLPSQFGTVPTPPPWGKS